MATADEPDPTFVDGSAPMDAVERRDGGASEPTETSIPAGDADTQVSLPPPPKASDAPVASCSGQPDMQLCQGTSGTPHVCINQACVPLGCGRRECNPTGPYFPWDPTAAKNFARTSGDEPVIQDLDTGLEWTGCVAGTRGSACTQGSMTWFDLSTAVAHCEGSTWAGHDDWFLPDAVALHALLRMGDSGIRVSGNVVMISDPEEGAGIPQSLLPRAGQALLISSTTWADTPAGIDATSGQNMGLWGERVICARLTRGTTPLPTPRFVVTTNAQGEKTAFDPITQRMWAIRKGLRATWPSAEAACESLKFSGVDDWRLPSPAEVISTVDWFSDQQKSPFEWDGEMITNLDSGGNRVLINAYGQTSTFGTTLERSYTCIREH